VIADSDVNLRWEVVDAFLAASRGGDFEEMLALPDTDVVLRADPAAVRMGASEEVRGPAAVAETLSGRARFARPALLSGAPGAVWSVEGSHASHLASQSVAARSSKSSCSPTQRASRS